MILQEHTRVEAGQERKYVVGTILWFLGYSPYEPAYESALEHGDILQVLPRNGCGMGIDVERRLDGFKTMVWPEEVELL